jgi:hypothetical protein
MLPRKLQLLMVGLLLCVLTLAVGCGGPKDERVRSEFLAENPQHRLHSVIVGEGDSSAAYFHIKHSAPGTTNIREAVWLYMENGKGEWEVRHKENLKP